MADQLGIVHHVFNFAADFEAHVVDPYVTGHAEGRTPNPCIECNRHLKFDRLLDRAAQLGFDAVATGHHARRARDADGTWRLVRGADPAKDQSYVLAMLGQDQLARTLFPVGDLTKAEVRDEAARRGLRTAAKPDSQDVCFIRSDVGRAGFLADRVALHPGRLVDHGSGRRPRRGGGRRTGHGGPASGHGPRHRRPTAVRDLGRRPGPAGHHRAARGVPGHRPGPRHRGLGRRSTRRARHTRGTVRAGPVQRPRSGRGVPPSGPRATASSSGSPNPSAGWPPGQTVALYDPDRPECVLGSGVVR